MSHAGAFVKETDLSVVHKAEDSMSAPDSEEVVDHVETAAQGVINYYFPVEVVVIGGFPEEEKAAFEAQIWENLSTALERST